jgi:hypothetical protein
MLKVLGVHRVLLVANKGIYSASRRTLEPKVLGDYLLRALAPWSVNVHRMEGYKLTSMAEKCKSMM